MKIGNCRGRAQECLWVAAFVAVGCLQGCDKGRADAGTTEATTDDGGSDHSSTSGGSALGTTSGPKEGTSESTTGGSVTEALGVCGVRSQGVVTRDSYQAYEEYYLLGDEGFGDALCVVRFEVTRVDDAPTGCDQFAGQQETCFWTHLVEYRNPAVLVDENGVCAHSELGMSPERIAAMDGKQVAYGYVLEYQGHDSVLLTHDAQQDTWTPWVNAGWTETSGDLIFDFRDGFCAYSTEGP